MPSPAGITRLPCPSVAPGHPPHPLITLSPPFGRSAVTSHHRPHLSARMSSYPPTYCFNGATTFQSWKLTYRGGCVMTGRAYPPSHTHPFRAKKGEKGRDGRIWLS